MLVPLGRRQYFMLRASEAPPPLEQFWPKGTSRFDNNNNDPRCMRPRRFLVGRVQAIDAFRPFQMKLDLDNHFTCEMCNKSVQIRRTSHKNGSRSPSTRYMAVGPYRYRSLLR